MQRRDYFAALLVTLRRINNSFEKLKTKELVPMPGDPEITAPYKQLIRFEREGLEYYFADDSEKKYSVKGLLGAITEKKIATEKDTKESLTVTQMFNT
ncbi:MAG: hypothetical protein KAW12_05465 [Candidatus Aminicenantes bacterium]|nr:hypothetical protein [Candidatus Aminicenantes bacterium]